MQPSSKNNLISEHNTKRADLKSVYNSYHSKTHDTILVR